MSDPNVSAILLDIEGTTTPIEFVYEVLFPFAQQHANEFIQQHRGSADVRADIDELMNDYLADVASGNEPPAWRDDSPDSWLESVTAYVHWLMKQDRKSTALKSLQGKIWEAGYLSGRLLGQVYSDVPGAFARWRKQEKKIYIYSSGSTLAQKLLFAHTNYGDLSGYINDYFDTTTGAKRAATSYQSIARQLALPAREVLFLSDVTAELDAARNAGMKTTLCVRPGNAETESTTHGVVHTFDVVSP
jgi:enolase-phosphatase E1